MTGSQNHDERAAQGEQQNPELHLIGSAQQGLPERLAERVDGHLEAFAAHMREGLLAASTAIGLEVMGELMEAEVTEIAGPKGQHDRDGRRAYRHGTEHGSVALGGRRVPVRRPRVRSTDAEQGETELASYRTFADTDLLAEHMVASMLAGLSTRKYPAALEPVGEQTEQQASSTSKSAVSRQFVTATSERLAELHQRRLNGQRWPILFVDGFTFGEHQLVGALGVTAEGGKVPLGVVEGTTENGVVATRLLADLGDRGLDATHGILLVVDGSKALDKAIRSVFGEAAVVQRCRRHKERNVLDHLPESEHAWVRRKLRAAWMRESAEQAEAELEEIARSLQRKRPGAAASLREGLAETVTVNRLGVGGKLLQTVESTNPVESMIEIVAWHAQRVKRWRDGDMALRWAAAGMFAAESQFRRVKGYRELPQLIGALTDTVGAEPISPEVDGDLTATA